MASAHDVAAAILRRTGEVDTYKLQKLVYYCQAWHLVWDEEPLFLERIEAWANGPVAPDLYARHRGSYRVRDWPSGDEESLTGSEVGTVEAVIEFYGKMSGYELSQLTHQESPWRDAREGLPPGTRSSRLITYDAMLEYYGGLVGVEGAEG